MELHRANGAHWAEENGWRLPARFGDPLKEYRSARSEAGLLDLSHRAFLRFTGSDRVDYLQGMVSNDVKTLTPGNGTHATVLDVHGKIQADVRIFCTEDSFLMDCWEPLKERVVAHLNRYLIADDVEIAGLTEQHGILSLQGPKARSILETFLSADSIPSKELDHSLVNLAGSEIRLVRAGHTGEEGFDLVTPLKDFESVALQLQETGKKFSLHWIGTQAQELLRVEAGIPRYGVDMNEDHLLLEVGLDRAVSFHKGCYLGQEVVERIRSRGHVNKKLVGLSLEGDSAANKGDPIRAQDKDVGQVTSSIFSPALKRPVALGYVHRDYIQPGTQVIIDHAGTRISAVVSALPFYKPS